MSEAHPRKLLRNKSKEVAVANKNGRGMFKCCDLNSSETEDWTKPLQIFVTCPI